MNSLFFKKGATKVVVLLVPLFFFLFTVPAFAQTDLDDDGIMDDVDDEVIVAENVTLEAGEYFFKDLVIKNGATLSLGSDANSTSAFKGARINVSSLVVEEGAKISADGMGYGSGQGPGYSGTGAGSSYGGLGESGYSYVQAPTYGSAIEPIDLGSGGINGASGGGVVRINASNLVINNGTISANASYGDGATGGSVFVTTDKLEGAGSFSANGGETRGYLFDIGAGAGGRVAVHYRESDFIGSASANRGDRYVGGPMQLWYYAESGSVTFLDTKNNSLHVSQNWRFQLSESPFLYDNIFIDGASATFEEGIHVEVNNFYMESGSLNLPDKCDFIVSLLDMRHSSLSLSGEESLDINNITIAESSVISLIKEGKVYLDIENLSIDSGSSIDVNGKGYGTDGPGTNIGGGSYGGVGENNTPDSIYGSPTEPTDLGSGGSGGGLGGGAIFLKISNTFENNGLVSARGYTDNSVTSGSGGSIYVITNNFKGSGVFNANGGDVGNYNGAGAGGGGRIAIFYNTSSFTGSTVANGGSHFRGWGSGYSYGQNGSVHIEQDDNLFKSFACSDGEDNDRDQLIDINDPGCHTDGDVSNSESYDPEKDDEYDYYIERVSVSSDDIIANHASYDPSVSGDGRYVVFTSGATNLVSDDHNNTFDIFIRDRVNGRTTRISKGINDTESNGYSSRPSISDDGRFVAYTSSATNLVEDDTNGMQDIFIYNREDGVTTRIGGPDGGQANGGSNYPEISGDGGYVVFMSGATNLVAGGTNSGGHIFLYDIVNDANIKIGNDAISLVFGISASGRFVTYSEEIASEDLYRYEKKIFVYDREENVSTEVDFGEYVSSTNNMLINNRVSISEDGNYIFSMFYEFGGGMVLIRLDRNSGVISKIIAADGLFLSYDILKLAVSNNGQYAVWEVESSEMVNNNPVYNTSVYVHDYDKKETKNVSTYKNVKGNYTMDIPDIDISEDGKYIVFSRSDEDIDSEILLGDNLFRGVFLARNPFFSSEGEQTNSPPELTLLGDNPTTLEYGQTYEEPGFTVTDDHDSDLVVSTSSPEEINPFVPGEYSIVYSVVDSGGLRFEVTRVVNVQPQILSFDGLDIDLNDGVEPNRGYPDETERVFKVIYKDANGDKPDFIDAVLTPLQRTIISSMNSNGRSSLESSAINFNYHKISSNDYVSSFYVFNNGVNNIYPWKVLGKSLSSPDMGFVKSSGFVSGDEIRLTMNKASLSDITLDLIVPPIDDIDILKRYVALDCIGYNENDEQVLFNSVVISDRNEQDDGGYLKKIKLTPNNDSENIKYVDIIINSNYGEGVYLGNVQYIDSTNKLLRINLSTNQEDVDSIKEGVVYEAKRSIPIGDYRLFFEAVNKKLNKPFVLNTDDNIVLSSGFDNVLFVPGIQGSRLYDDEGKLWLPLRLPGGQIDLSGGLTRLSCDINGNSESNRVYTEDIIDEALGLKPLPNVYKDFIGRMDSLEENDLIYDWYALPYDWRLDYDDVINNGSQVYNRIYYANDPMSQNSKPYIPEKMMQLIKTSRSGKVTIVAHSMGGLITKRLLSRLEDENDYLYSKSVNYEKIIDNINNVILVASPQIGTPQAVSSLLHGADPIIFLSEIESRNLANNMSSVYGLLPTEKYAEKVKFINQDEYIIKINSLDSINQLDQTYLNSYGSRYGEEPILYGSGNIDEYAKFKELLIDGARPDVKTDDLRHSVKLNSTLFDVAQDIHSSANGIDNWVIPDSINVYQLVGHNIDTVSGIEYFSEKDGYFCELPDKSIAIIDRVSYIKMNSTDRLNCTERHILGNVIKHTVNGDGTVTVPSAAYLSNAKENVNTYYLDLAGYFFQVGEIDSSHAYIMNSSQVNDIVSQIIEDDSVELPISYVSTEAPNNGRFFISVHSPITIGVYDMQGKFTGIIYDDETGSSTIYEEIPNSSYFESGEGKYLSLEPGQEYRVVMEGMGDGYFTFFAEEVQGMGTVKEIAYHNVPVKNNTVAEIIFDEDGDAGELIIDEDGDGNTDYSVPTAESYSDNIAPTTSLSLNGNMYGASYLSLAEFTLDATDNEDGSGVKKSEYSLDNGITWEEYTGTTTVSGYGEHTILYRSEDWFGNVEEIQTVTFRIVTARELLQDADTRLGALDSNNPIKQTIKQLEQALGDKYWQDNNTLSSLGGKSVFAHLRNAIKYISDDSSLNDIAEDIKLAQEILLKYNEEEVSGNSGSSGGGGGHVSNHIREESIRIRKTGNNSATINWLSSRSCVGKIVYSGEDERHKFNVNNTLNYGYANVFSGDKKKSTGHEMTVSNLESGTTYYYRVISSCFPDIISQEHSFTTKGKKEKIKVLGLEYTYTGDIDSLYGQNKELVEMISLEEAELVYGYSEVLELTKENQVIFDKLVAGLSLSNDVLKSIAYFIQEGTRTTRRLGAGERAGVLNSYYSAFGVMPESVIDWQDVIKIANGRWPGKTNEEARTKATSKFAKVYRRSMKENNQNDDSAITIISYGLRPANRNMESEKSAIKTFKDVYGKNPESATDWDLVRAIAYSGCKR
jgi:hypothetical protein